jgi:hypothetical protein
MMQDWEDKDAGKRRKVDWVGLVVALVLLVVYYVLPYVR